MQATQRTKFLKTVIEIILYHYRYLKRIKTLYMGEKPPFIPITRAREYYEMLKKEGLSRNQLSKRLGVSRVRVTQFLNLLKLSQKQQDYVLRYGKEKLITKKALRKGNITASGVQKL